jgi:hypothetical protein
VRILGTQLAEENSRFVEITTQSAECNPNPKIVQFEDAKLEQIEEQIEDSSLYT